MSVATGAEMSLRECVTASHIMSAPLPDLLAEVGAELVESAIDDDGFFGAVVECRDGRIVLAMPQGRPGWERDVIARSLLGNVLGVGLSPLPAPVFETVTA